MYLYVWMYCNMCNSSGKIKAIAADLKEICGTSSLNAVDQIYICKPGASLKFYNCFIKSAIIKKKRP